MSRTPKTASQDMKRFVAHYLRYDLQCPVLGLEVASSLATSFNDGGSADVIAINKRRYLIEVEIKISLVDLKADRRKNKHEYYRKCCELPYNNQQMRFGQVLTIEPPRYPTHLFYFAVPYNLADDALLICEGMFPYAGLLTNQETYYGNIIIRRPAQILSRDKLTLREIMRVVKGQSATIVRLLDEVCNCNK